jgi:phosphoribosylaminoimidazole-succinocarboxamide synthase
VPAPLFQSSITSLPLLSRGKVRDIYAVDPDKLLIVTTDRLSAFDVVLPDPIPRKGEVLTAVADFWFAMLARIVPNHLTGIEPESVVSAGEREQVHGRSVVARRLRPLPIEAVVRGYVTGSGWSDYQATGGICGIPLPPGLRMAARLPAPIFTPATKAAVGDHDENVSFEQAQTNCQAALADVLEGIGKNGAGLCTEARDAAIGLYREASAHAATRGIIIADTKFEFGRDKDGHIILIDEVMTPDSSRFWAADAYKPGQPQPSFDKQPLRDYLDAERRAGRWNGEAPPPPLPASVVDATSKRYLEAYRRVTGAELKI